MHENHMMIILMIRTENKGWLCYCHMLLVSKKQKMEHATLKIRVGQKYTGSVLVVSSSFDIAISMMSCYHCVKRIRGMLTW